MGHGGVSITLCHVQAVLCRPSCKMVWMCSPLDACLGDVRSLACVSGVKVGASSQCPLGPEEPVCRLVLYVHAQLPGLWLLNFNEPQLSFWPRLFKVSGDERKEGVLETDGFSFFPSVSTPGGATWSPGCGRHDSRSLAVSRELGPRLGHSSLFLRDQRP